MKFKIKELNIRTWRGIKHVSLHFENGQNWIYGKNGSCKSSIFAAFIWLLFGKDQFGRADYNIRPWDVDGQPLHHIESSVEGTFELSGNKVTFKRLYKEKWVKPKGQLEDVYDGNTTKYYINDVEVQKTAYDQRISSICDETLFKSITSPHYFPSLKENEQRTMLFSLIADIPDDEIADTEDFKQLLKDVTGSSFEAFKTQINNQKRKDNEAKQTLSDRIAERKSIVYEAFDWAKIQAEIELKNEELRTIESAISDVTKASELRNKELLNIQYKINSLEAENENIRNNAKMSTQSEISKLQSEISALNDAKRSANREYETKKARLDFLIPEKERLSKDKAALLEVYLRIKAEQFAVDNNNLLCPTCGQSFVDSESRVEKMIEGFNKDKASRIATNVSRGQSLKVQIESIEKEIEEIGEISPADISGIQTKIEELEKKISDLRSIQPVYGSLYDANIGLISELSLKKVSPIEDKDYSFGKQTIKNEIAELNKKLGKKEAIEENEKRIEELNRQFDATNSHLAELEKKEFTMKEFEFKKNSELEKRINEFFEFVQFKLFRKQVNGEIVQTCECMADGTLYSTQNNAMQFAMGLDIIRVLSKKLNVYAPIFLDNRESVTEIPEMECQIINLVVDSSKEKLTM